jgi:hypothetical protein
MTWAQARLRFHVPSKQRLKWHKALTITLGISDHTRSDQKMASKAERRDVGDSDRLAGAIQAITKRRSDSPETVKLANASASD